MKKPRVYLSPGNGGVSPIEYTMRCIHDEASKLASLTERPEVGLFSYLIAVGESMDRLNRLRTVQQPQ